jgi:hypothetical protein
LHLRALIGISYDSRGLCGFQKLFRAEPDPECDLASVGYHFEELFRLTPFLRS